MKRLWITDEEWSQLKDRLQRGNYLESAFIILGPSKDIAVNVQALLESGVSLHYNTFYYLSSGSEMFHIPCYKTFIDSENTDERLEAYHVLENAEGILIPGPATYSPNYAAIEIQKTIKKEKSRPPLILIEWITSPIQNDIIFVQLVLDLIRHVPIVIFLHQRDETDGELSWQGHSIDNEPLLLLHMCGGRMRKAEWSKLIDQCFSNSSDSEYANSQLIASRRVGRAAFVCYAHRSAAELAEKCFSNITLEKKQELVCKLFHVLPQESFYPIFAIACHTDKLDDILSKYSCRLLKAAFSDPADILRYFRHIRRLSKKSGNSVLNNIVSINYITSLLCIYRTNVAHIYSKLQQVDFSDIDKDAAARLWFTLGQLLTKAKERQMWEDALECYNRSRACLEVADMSQVVLQSRLAAIANGEALVALKLQQRDQAFELEKSALKALHGASKNSAIILQDVLIRTNLGEVRRHMFNDIEGAITHYEAAYALALSTSSLEARGYVVPKLAEVLMQMRRVPEAIEILRNFLVKLKQAPGTSTLTDAMATLKIQLMLAQAYLETRQQRKAAVCYWILLRHPQQLKPAVLRGIATNLLHCRPGISMSLHARIHRIIAEQEEIMVGMSCIQSALSDMK